jgi:hypothetical protein
MSPTGTTAQWVTSISATGVFVTLLGLLIRGVLGWGRLSNEADNSLAGHTAKELQSLRDQINSMGKHQLEREREIDDRWRKTLAESEARHDECVKQRETLGRKVIELEAKLIGTIRQFIHFQQRIAEAIAKGADTRGLLASLQPYLEEEMKPGLGE